jgi:putative component of toxin-antitoxin plasmid stabilization module
MEVRMSDEFVVVFSSGFRDEVIRLPDGDRAWITRKLADLRKKTWSAAVHDRTVAPLRDGIWEVRIVGRGAAYRLLFFIVPGRSPRVIVLTSCAAKAAMTKKKLLDASITRALDRRAGWLEQEAKKRGR